MKTGSQLIAEERERQLAVLDWAINDNRHVLRELARAGLAYVEHYVVHESVPKSWPYDDKDWNPKDPISDLVKAGAFIAAEIDKLQGEHPDMTDTAPPPYGSPAGSSEWLGGIVAGLDTDMRVKLWRFQHGRTRPISHAEWVQILDALPAPMGAMVAVRLMPPNSDMSGPARQPKRKRMQTDSRPADASPGSAPLGGSAKRLKDAVSSLMEIIEGVRNARWAHEGRRLVDTPEWCELYCAWSALKRQHPEAMCDDCGGANVVWHAPSEVWNKVCRPNGEIAADPMLCPTCFIARAKLMGIDEAWVVSPNSDMSGPSDGSAPRTGSTNLNQR